MLVYNPATIRFNANANMLNSLLDWLIIKRNEVYTLLTASPQDGDWATSPYYDWLQEHTNYCELIAQVKQQLQHITLQSQKENTMKPIHSLPVFEAAQYTLNLRTRYYEAIFQGIDRMTNALRVDTTSAERIRLYAEKMIVSRERNGNNFKFRTGLQPTMHEGWYVGNDYEMIGGKKVISLILFHFKEDGYTLDIYYFRHFDKQKSSQRMKWAYEIIPHLEPVTL